MNENKKKFHDYLKNCVKEEFYKDKKFNILVICVVIYLFCIHPLCALLYILFLLLVLQICYLITVIPVKNEYEKSLYNKINNIEFVDLFFDYGARGEWETYKILKQIKGYNKILVNLYIPKNLCGEKAEIDLIFIHKTGIYVFESKNFSGWIFGKEQDKTWTQCLKKDKRNTFNNPIRQNRNHIKAILKYLPFINVNAYKSYIVFSERCTLRKIEYTSPNVRVMKRNNLLSVLENDFNNSNISFSDKEIDRIYYKLEKYMHVSDEVKSKHIEDIRKNIH